ncbi:YgeY family selenium metabolism-linked hydrolase [Anaeroselena agilis]|uniref:YgeY family selenium metabolism-linked hydrolase n=1 Tax=Anaeroselena agilis TaxID=3063788 RepID=A0ABU3P271_9FIRM|nr:YgeY family selenium metabolism-linked hydrolase [Selenomonadales bacterium 4137-cl]
MKEGLVLRPPVAPCDESAMIRFCQRLVRQRSYTGEEGGVAKLLAAAMTELGFDDVRTDAAGNVIGEIRGGPGPKLLFDGHMDTVEVSDREKWSVDPFAGVIKDGRLYGRGASDMKCALAAMVYGLAPLAKYKDKLKGSVVVSGTVCEETFEGLALGRVVEAVRPDYVVIGEASALSLKRGQRGRAEIAVTTFGKAAHSSNPAVGKNAVYMMMKLAERIVRTAVPRDDFLGEGILELTDIVSVPYPGASVVPHQCRATFDRRLLVGETEESVLAPLRRCVAELAADDGAFRAEVEVVTAEQVCYTGEKMAGKRFFPAWVLPETDCLVAGALRGLRQGGLDPEVTKYSFCTNGSYSAGIAGIPTIGFGPGREDGAHVVDEYMELNQLTGAAAGYQAIAASILKFDE